MHFWYDFEAKKGEWAAKDLTIPIRMQFSGISPSDVKLRIYDISGERERDSLRAGKSYRSEYVCCERSIRIHVLQGNGIGNYYRKDSQIIANPRRQSTPHGSSAEMP